LNPRLNFFRFSYGPFTQVVLTCFNKRTSYENSRKRKPKKPQISQPQSPLLVKQNPMTNTEQIKEQIRVIMQLKIQSKNALPISKLTHLNL
jgi:hypothetical protein